jgi:acetoin utilization protein AcuB
MSGKASEDEDGIDMFTVYGPGVTDPVHLEKLFVRPTVPKSGAISPKQAIKPGNAGGHSPSAYQSELAKKQYQTVETANERHPALKASQIMTVPVVSVQAHSTVLEALNILDVGGFRHIPVLSPDNQLVGMISDRDIIRCMCGSGSVCVHCSATKQDMLIDEIMKDRVLTANVDTDARHIARLFVEQRIGAIPVVENGRLAGIITRSDILRAVMLHFDLNIWI